MSYEREEACPKPPARWQLRCRPLERDDVKGAILRYGGKRKQLRPVLQREPAQPPVGVTPGSDSTAGSSIRWSLGAGAVRAFISVRRTRAPPRRSTASTGSTSRCTRPAATA